MWEFNIAQVCHNIWKGSLLTLVTWKRCDKTKDNLEFDMAPNFKLNYLVKALSFLLAK